MQKYDVVSFNKLILAGASVNFDYVVPDYGTIEQVNMYFAQGQEFCLQVRPVIIQSGSGLPTDIITFADGTDRFIAGDNITIERRVTRPLTPGDIIRIMVTNTDGVNNVNLACDVSIDYYAGKARVQ